VKEMCFIEYEGCYVQMADKTPANLTTLEFKLYNNVIRFVASVCSIVYYMFVIYCHYSARNAPVIDEWA
jgi:hypothetical protein